MKVTVTATTKPNTLVATGVLQHLLEQAAIKLAGGETSGKVEHKHGVAEFTVGDESLPADPPAPAPAPAPAKK